VENGDHASLTTKVLRISADDADRLSRSFEQDVVDNRLVLERDGGDRSWHSEDDVKITDRQKVSLTVCEPLRTCEALALWAVSVAATIESDANRAAVLAALDMAAERCGATNFDGGHDAALVARQPTALCGAECIAMAAENIRHLQCGTHEPGSARRDDLQSQPVERAWRLADRFGGNLSIKLSTRQIGVSQQDLDDAQVRSVFQKVGR
jgi:hypothetical protein